jgi:hypothetical protein
LAKLRVGISKLTKLICPCPSCITDFEQTSGELYMATSFKKTHDFHDEHFWFGAIENNCQLIWLVHSKWGLVCVCVCVYVCMYVCDLLWHENLMCHVN